MKRKNKNICIAAVVVILTVLILAAGYFVYDVRLKTGSVDASVSGDGEYELLLQSVGEPDRPFGYTHARLVLKHNGKTVTKYRFDIADDGGILSVENWSVVWEKERAVVTVYGEEQGNVEYILSFDGSVMKKDAVQSGNSYNGTPDGNNPEGGAVPDFSAIVRENGKGESFFDILLDAFVDCYNSQFRKKYGEDYLTAPGSENWDCFSEKSPCFGCVSERSRFSENKEIRPAPRMNVYSSDNGIYEVRVTFSEHGYQQIFYDRFRQISTCLLSMVCRDMTDGEIDTLFDNLYKSSDYNFFGDHSTYADPEKPVLTEVYRYGNAGFYCFFGTGTIEICMIPVTPSAAAVLQSAGTEIHAIKK